MPDHVNGTVVVLRHNRRPELLRKRRALTAPNERPPVVAVDNGNGSSDGTPDAVAAAFSGVGLTRLDRNFGAVGRNIAVDAAPTDCGFLRRRCLVGTEVDDRVKGFSARFAVHTTFSAGFAVSDHGSGWRDRTSVQTWFASRARDESGYRVVPRRFRPRPRRPIWLVV
jgi:hypothetical protein